MARYIREVQINKPGDFVNYMVNDFLTKHGFQLVEFKGQQVFRAGGGMIEIPKFLVWSYQNGVFHIEAWTRNVWLPGVYGRENAMTGFLAAVPKGIYKRDIEQLLQLLFQPIPGETGNAPVSDAIPAQNITQGGAQRTVYVQGVDTSRYATMGMVMGIVGIVTSWLWGVGIIFSIMGIIYGRKGQSSSNKGAATAGFVCGIIGTVLSAMMILFYVWIMAAGLLLTA